jgi:hypothetical protein
MWDNLALYLNNARVYATDNPLERFNHLGNCLLYNPDWHNYSVVYRQRRLADVYSLPSMPKILIRCQCALAEPPCRYRNAARSVYVAS